MKKALTESLVFSVYSLLLITMGFAAEQQKVPSAVKPGVTPPPLSERAKIPTPPPSGPCNLKTIALPVTAAGNNVQIKMKVIMESSNPAVVSEPTGVEIFMGDSPGSHKKFLGFHNVPGMKNGTSHEISITVPADAAKGQFFEGCVDPRKRIPETNEDDNCGVTSYMVP